MTQLPVIVSALAASLFSLQAYAADEYPTTGIIYNTTEDSSLTYNCTKMQSGLLECEFVQTSVRKKSKPEDLKKELEQAKKQFPDAIKNLSSDKDCDFMIKMLAILEGKETPEEAAQRAPKGAIADKEKFIRAMKEMPNAKKEELLVNLRAMKDFCSTHSEESYLKVTRLQIDKEMRTCIVGSHPFKQTFRWVSDYASGAGVWVVDSKPEGPCGIVELSRFEFDLARLKSDSKLGFWKYYAKKSVTNPKGTVLLGMACSGMDEREYIYDWKTDREYNLGCEYIDFSPL